MSKLRKYDMSQLESSYFRRSPRTSLSQYLSGPVDLSFSERFKILNNLPSCNNATSSIDIDNIAIFSNQPTNMKMQSLSVPPAQNPIFDNIPLSNETRRENDTDNDSEISESQ